MHPNQSRLQAWLVAVFFALFLSLPAATQCPGCPPGSTKPCSGVDVRANPACGALFQAAIDCLSQLAQSKGNPNLTALAMCLQSSLDNGYLRLCTGGSDWLAITEANCVAPDGTHYWCANASNCICFNASLLDDDCAYNGENLFDSKYIIMAALAHEMCHAKGFAGSATPGNGGLDWGASLCDLLCSEVDCHCLELDLLECSPSTGGIGRRAGVICQWKNYYIMQKFLCID